MNVFFLKTIALISMITDHYGAIFQGNIDIYRIIGRLAFPIYCFLLVEGYFHTKDVKKYAKRLFIFALISELPFDFAFYNMLEFRHQNIFFTLLLGLVAIYLLENKEEKYNFSKTSIMFTTGLLSIILFVDYGIIGIVYILTFYFTRDYPKPKRFYRIALIMFFTNIVSFSITQQFSILSLPIIYFYNGELGSKNKIKQMLFYVVYPLHLAVFYICDAGMFHLSAFFLLIFHNAR